MPNKQIPLQQLPERNNPVLNDSFNDYGADKAPKPYFNQAAQIAREALGDVYKDPHLQASELETPYYSPWEAAKHYDGGKLGYNPMDIDTEDAYAQKQSGLSQGINGLLKGVVTAGTAFVDGTAGLVVGGLEALSTGDFSKLFNNEITNADQNIRDGAEDVLPNYYTKGEREAPLYSPAYWAHINFLADKVVKNLGWSAAAIGEGQLVAKLASNIAGKLILGKADDIIEGLEKSVSAIKSGQVAEGEANGFLTNRLKSYLSKPIDDLGEMGSIQSRYGSLNSGVQKGIERFSNVLASATEASSEALQGYRDTKKDLIKQYEDEHYGIAPDSEAMQNIEQRAKSGADLRWALNVGLLSITNNIEFPRLINGSIAFEKKLLGKETLDLVSSTGTSAAKLGETYTEKALGKWARRSNYLGKTIGLVAPVEGLEEGAQFAIESGIHDYEMREKDPDAIGAINNVLNYGISNTIGTREGRENILLGMLSGGISEKVLGHFNKDNVKQNTKDFLSIANTRGEEGKEPVINQAGQFVSGYDNKKGTFASELPANVVRGVSILMDKKEAAANNDHFEVKNLDADFTYNYVIPRVKYNRFDKLKEELSQYKNRPLEETVKELGLPEDTTQEEVNARVDSLIEKATKLKNIWSKVSMAYGSQTTNKDGKKVPKYSQKDIDRLAYLTWKMDDADTRMNNMRGDIDSALSKAGSKFNTTALFNKEARVKPIDETNIGKDEYYDLEEVRNNLSKSLSTVDPTEQYDSNGISLDEKLADIERLQNDKESKLNSFNLIKSQDRVAGGDIFANPANYTNYEESVMRIKQLQELQKNTELRPFVNDIHRAISQGKQEGKDLKQMLSEIRSKNSFVWDHMRPELIAAIDKELIPFKALQKQREDIKDAIERRETLYGQQQVAEFTGTDFPTPEESAELSKLVAEDLESKLDEVNDKLNNSDYSELAKIKEALGKDLANVRKEPKLLTKNQLRHQVVEEILEDYQEIKNNVEATATIKDGKIEDIGDYGDENTLHKIAYLLKMIDKLKSVFSQRKDISFTDGPFKGYLETLDNRKDFLEQVESAIKKKLADREAVQKRSEQTYVEGFKAVFNVPEVKVIFSKVLGEDFSSVLEKDATVEQALAIIDKFKASAPEDAVAQINKIVNSVLQKQKALVDKVQSQIGAETISSYYEKNPQLAFNRVLNTVTSREEESNSAYANYKWHQNPIQLWQDTINEEPKEGSDQYLTREERLELLQNQALLTILPDIKNDLSADISYGDIIASLRTIVAEANKNKDNVPTTQQLISVIQAVMANYSTAEGPYSNWVYLEGVIGAGKTSVFTNYTLATIAHLENKAVKDIVWATANTSVASETINSSLGIDSKPDITDTVSALNNDSFDKEVIILDEAARPTSQLLDSLEKAVSEYNKRNETSVKVIAIGDTNQVTDSVYPEISETPVRALLPFSISYRSPVSSISDIQAVYKSAGFKNIDNIETSGNVSRIQDAPTEVVYGVYGSKDENDLLSAINSRPAEIGGKPLSKALIVNKGKEAFWKAKLNDPSVTVVNYYDAQGKTFDEVYLWLQEDPNDTPIINRNGYNKVIYTNMRGRNLVFIGNTNVNTRQSPAVEAMVGQNQAQNTERGRLLLNKLDKALSLFGVEAQEKTPTSATEKESEKPSYVQQGLKEKADEELYEELSTGLSGEEQIVDEQEDGEEEQETEPVITDKEEQIITPADNTKLVSEDNEPVEVFTQAEPPAGEPHQLSYPTGPSLNNIETDDILVVAVPYNGSFRLSVLQPTADPAKFKEIAILGENNGEVEQLGFAGKLAEMNKLWGTKTGKDVIEEHFKSVVNNEVTFSNPDVVQNYLVGSGKLDMRGTSPMSYQYDHSSGQTVFSKGKTLLNYIQNRIKSLFNGNAPEPLLVNENGGKDRKGIIFTSTQETSKKYTGATGKRLTTPGKTYMLFQNKVGNKIVTQAVELTGRILDYSEPLHYTIYGDPIVSYFNQVDAFTEAAGIDAFLDANPQLLKDANLTKESFVPGTRYWNRLIIFLSDGRYKETLTSDKDSVRKYFPEAKQKLYLALIEHLQKNPKFQDIRRYAQNMDNLVYKKHYKKEWYITKSEDNAEQVEGTKVYNNEDEAYEYVNATENNIKGYHVGSRPTTYTDDFGQEKPEHTGYSKASAGKAQLAIMHTIKANPVIEREGKKTLFPMYTKTFKVYRKGEEKEIRQYQVRPILHHRMEGGIGSMHDMLLEQYIMKKLGIDKAFGTVYEKDKNGQPLRKASSKKLETLRKQVVSVARSLNGREQISSFGQLLDELTSTAEDNFHFSGSWKIQDIYAAFGKSNKNITAYLENNHKYEGMSSNERSLHDKLRDKVLSELSDMFDGNPENIEAYRNAWKEVQKEKNNYQTQLDHESIKEILHPKEAINERGEHKLGLKVNIPLSFSFRGIDRSLISYDPQTGVATQQDTKMMSADDTIHAMLTTKFSGVRQSSAAVVFDGQPGSKTDNSTPKENTTQKTASRKKFLSKDREIANPDNKVVSSTGLAYAKRFLPNLTADDMFILDRLKFMKAVDEDAYGAFMDGVIYLQENEDGTVAAEAIRHEVFHAVMANYLTASEREAVMKAARMQYGMSTDNDIDVEEQLAEDFQKRKDYTGLTGILVNFFRNLRRLFNIITGNRNRVNELFERIERAKFTAMRNTRNSVAQQTVFLSKIQKVFNGDPYVMQRAKTLVNKYMIENGILATEKGSLPMTDREIKDKLIEDIENLYLPDLQKKLDNRKDIDDAEHKTVLDKWSKLTPKQQDADEEKFYNGEESSLFHNLWRTDVEEQQYKALKGLLKKNSQGEYFVINEYIKHIKPDVSVADLYSATEDAENNEREGENINDHIDKDDSKSLRKSLTGELKMFLSTISNKDNTKFVGLEQAIYFIYENISGFNGLSLNQMKAKIAEQFTDNTGINSWQKQAVLDALVGKDTGIIDMALAELSKENLVDNNGNRKVVSLNDRVGFKDTNTFYYPGLQVVRKSLESTPDFFNRIINELTSHETKGKFLYKNDKHTDEWESTSDFSNESNLLVLKSYWQRDMAMRIFKDMINLADSLYFTNPYTSDYSIDNGKVSLRNYSLQPDKDAMSNRINIIDAMWNNREALSHMRMDSGAIDIDAEKFLKLTGFIPFDAKLEQSPKEKNDANTAVKNLVSVLYNSEDRDKFNYNLANAKGYLNTIGRVLSYAQQENKNISAYVRPDGKLQFFQRYLSYATRFLQGNLNFGRRMKGNSITFLTPQYKLPFYRLNPLFDKIFSFSLDEGFKEKDNNDSAVAYDSQSSRDYLFRTFVTQFLGTVANNLGSEARYWQNFYTASDKSVNINAQLDIIMPTGKLFANSEDKEKNKPSEMGERIARAIIQEFERPSASGINVKNYTEKKRLSTLLPGLDSEESQAIREDLRTKYEALLADNKPEEALKKLYSEAGLEKLVSQVYTAIEQQAAGAFDEMWAINERALNTDNGSRMDARKGVLFPSKDQMSRIYYKLPFSAEGVSISTTEDVTGDNRESRLVGLEKYSPDIWNWNVEKSHIYPAFHSFFLNNYVNGLFLNQLVAGDAVFFKSAVDQVKRMSGPFAVGMSPLVMSEEDRANYKDDSVYQNAVSPNPRLMNPKFRVMIAPDIYNIRRADGTTDYKFYTEEQAKAAKEKGDSEINLTDGGGFMSNRRYNQTLKGFGPGLDIQPNQKPVHWEIDKHGVPRYLKYATFALTDSVCKQFPRYLAQRIMMETHGMTAKDQREAGELIKKQVMTSLSGKEQARLEELFATNEGSYIDEIIHESGIKVGIPATLAHFNGNTFEHVEGSSVELSNINWRIQLNPTADIDSHVSLMTQLLYYACFDKHNVEKAFGVYDSLAKLFNSNLSRLLNKFGVSSIEELNQSSPEVADKVKKLITERVKNTPGKERLWEYISTGTSLDAPFISNDISTQLAAVFNKNVIGVKFPGSKFQLLSSEMIGNGDNLPAPKWDRENNIMEVYLPNHWAKSLGVENLDNKAVKDLNMMLGWRVPSTGLNSGTRIKIIGFWPTEMNVVVAPGDIHLQMGSDLDVDSLFVAKYELFTEEEKNIARVLKNASGNLNVGAAVGFNDHKEVEGFEAALENELSNKDTGRIARRILDKFHTNKLINTYMDMLADPQNAKDVSRPTDFSLIEDPEKGVKAHLEKHGVTLDAVKDLNNIVSNMKMYLANRSGKALTGIGANTAKTIGYLAGISHTTGNPIGLSAITYNGEVYDHVGYGDSTGSIMTKDGQKISTVLAVMVNVAVDNAKNQYLAVLNMTSANANAYFSLLASGFALNSAVTVMRQPVIMEISDLGRIGPRDITAQRKRLFEHAGINSEVVEAVPVSDEALAKYLKFNSINEAKAALSEEEFKEFTHLQLSVLDLFETAQKNGDGLYSISRALTVLQNNQPNVQDMENVLDHIYKIYPVATERTPSSDNGTFKFKLFTPESETLRDIFPIKNADLFKLPHWRAAFQQNQALYLLNKATLFRNGGIVMRLAQDIEKSFGVKLHYQANTNRARIRSEIMKILLTGIHFSHAGETVDFSCFDETPYVAKDKYGNEDHRQPTRYKTEAFMARFVDEVRKRKAEAKKSGTGNRFFDLLRIEYDNVSKMDKIITKDITGLTSEYEELKIIENSFKEIDSDKRIDKTGFNSYWFSPFQWDFVKYLTITKGLSFGSTSYAWLLPPEIMKPVTKAFDKNIEDIKNIAVKHLVNSDAYMNATEAEREEMRNRALTEQVVYNTLKDNLSTLMAIQIAKNSSENQRSLSFSKENTFKLSMMTDKEGNFYNLSVSKKAAEDEVKKSTVVDSDTDEQNIADAPKADIDNNAEVVQESEQTLYDKMPMLVRYKDSPAEFDETGTTVIRRLAPRYYVLVKSGQNKNGDVLYQLVGRASNIKNYVYSSKMLDKGFSNLYTIGSFFNSKTYYTNENNIKEEGNTITLNSNIELKIGTQVMNIKTGDPLRISSDRYTVEKVLKEGDNKAFKESYKSQKEVEKAMDSQNFKNITKKLDSATKLYKSEPTPENFNKLEELTKVMSELEHLKEQLELKKQDVESKKFLYELRKVNDGISIKSTKTLDDLSTTEQDMDNGLENEVNCKL